MAAEANETIKRIMMMLEMTQDSECDCGQVYEILDEVAEMTAAGVDFSAELPLIKHHLEMCGACHAEYEMLTRIISPDNE